MKTFYTLSVWSDDNKHNFELSPAMKNVLDRLGVHPAEYNGDQESSWFNHEHDVAELSRIFPYVMFALDGKGEQYDDLWIKYFMNGKMQECRAIITYPEFDPDQLKEISNE